MASDYDFESSDILGGSLPVGPRRAAQNSGFSSFFKVCALGASTLLLLLAFRHGRTFFLRWKERHYKLSMRRRYGIPDHDQRSFNVAYAAARLAQDDSRRPQDRMRNVPTFDQPNTLGHDPTGPGEGHGLAAHPSLPPVTLQVSGLDKNAKQITQRLPFSASTATQPLRVPVPSSHPDVSRSRLQFESGHANTRDEDAEDQREAKSERDHPVHDSGIDVDSAPVPRRSKRVADSSDDSDLRYSLESRHDKRRRKVSSRHPKKRIQKGDGLEMNDLSEVKLPLGGKKRDRTEMDLSFGAEDDMLYNDQDTDFELHRHRRRRQRKSTNSFRGQKRGRDADSLGVDTDSGDVRGRRKAFRHRPDTSDTEPSVEDGQLSRDPLCGGRRVGEEWEAHGVQFRVGPDGKRLRRVLVKEDRPKFTMPVDSEHPDRSASVTAIVERWYTEEQYTAAKEAHELAWQDSDKSFAESETSGDRSGNSSGAGKQLLWASTSNTGSPVRKIRISGHSSIASPRMVSFPMIPPPQYTRRVSTSLYSSSAVTPTEMSPKLRQSKSYSKWEKQEIEAEAMARLRRKAEEKEKAKAEAEAKEAEAKKVAIASTLSAIPLPKPDEKPSVAPPTGASPFSLLPSSKGDSKVTEPSNPPPLFKIPTPSLNVQSSEAKDKSEANTAAAPPGPLFPFPSAPIPATQASTSIPTAGGLVSSNSTTPTFFTNTTQPTTTSSSAPDGKGSAAASFFSFAQAKPSSNNHILNPSSAPQGSSSTAPQSTFSFAQNPKPPTSTEGSSNPSASTVPASGTSDASKPKFNFGVTSKPTSVTSSNPNPPAAATPSNAPPKPMFSFGVPKNSSAPTVQPVTNPFSNASASSTTAAPTQPSVFGTNEGKSAGVPASGIVPAFPGFKASEGTSSTNQGQSIAGTTGNSTTLFGAPNGGTQAQGGAAKSPSFVPTSLSTTKPFFSFRGGSDATKPEPKPEPGKSAPTFSFNIGSASSTSTAVPPTPGSVFSDTASKSSQSANPITQPSFGAPKNAAAPSAFTFGQSSGPGAFSFGSFGSQKP